MCGILKVSSEHRKNHRTKRKFEYKLEDPESESDVEFDSESTTKSKSKSDKMNSRLQIKHSKWGNCKIYAIEDSKSKLKISNKTIEKIVAEKQVPSPSEKEELPELVKPGQNLEMEMLKETPRVVLPNCQILKECLLNGSKKIRIQRSLEAEKAREREKEMEKQIQKKMEIQRALKLKQAEEAEAELKRKLKRFQRLQCPDCSFTCYAPRRMNRHGLSHLYQTRFPCSKCSHSFGSETVLALHAKTHADRSNSSHHQKNENTCMKEIDQNDLEQSNSLEEPNQIQVQIQINQILDKLDQDEKEMKEEEEENKLKLQQQQSNSPTTKPNFKGISKSEAQIMEELEISKILLSFSTSITNNLSNLEARKQQQQHHQLEDREMEKREEISIPISMPTPVPTPTPSPVKMSEGIETEQVRLYYQTESKTVPFNEKEEDKLVLNLQVDEKEEEPHRPLPTPATTPSSPSPPITFPVSIHMPVSISLKEPLPLHSISTRVAQPLPNPSLMEVEAEEDEEAKCIDLRIHRRKRSSQSTNSSSSHHHHHRAHHLHSRKRHRPPPSNNLMDVNGNKLPILACPYCDYWTTENGHLTVHMTSHAESFVPYKCSLCEFFTADQATLTKHSSKNHGADRDQEVPSSKAEWEKKAYIKCPFPGCLYFAKHRSLLRSHQIVHTQEKAFCCEICFKKFGRRSDKNRHMRSHGRLNMNVNMDPDVDISRHPQSYPVHRPHHEIYRNQSPSHHRLPFARSPPMEKMQTQLVERQPPLLSYPASVIKFGSDYHAHSRDERIQRFQPRANWE